MTVDLEPFGVPNSSERLAVLPVDGGNYVVTCLPFFTTGIQFGDLVELRASDNEFVRVLMSAGLRTLRFSFGDTGSPAEAFETIDGRIAASGLPVEWHGTDHVAILLQDERDQERALSCLAEFISDSYGDLEIDPEPFA